MARHIKAAMVTFLDKKLENNGLAQHAIKTKDPRTLFIVAAQACVGIREVGGNNRGPMVELIQKTVDGVAQGEAWCMAFIQTLIAYCELKTGIESPLFASEHCMTVWTKTSKTMRVKLFPLPGAIAIWNYEGTSNGHTGCLVSADPEKKEARMVEGNTNSGVDPKGNVERDGGGVYFTKRSMKGSGKMKLVGWIKPFPDAVSSKKVA